MGLACLLLLFLLRLTINTGTKLSNATSAVAAYNRTELSGDAAIKYAKEHNIDVPERLTLVKLVIPATEELGQTQSRGRPPWGYYLRGLSPISACSSRWIHTTSTTAALPGTLSSSVSEVVDAKWSASVKISPDVVSRGVGFDVRKSYSVADSYQFQISSGEPWGLWEIRAYPYYDGYTFEVWYNPMVDSAYKAGTGSAFKPVGVCFAVFKY